MKKAFVVLVLMATLMAVVLPAAIVDAGGPLFTARLSVEQPQAPMLLNQESDIMNVDIGNMSTFTTNLKELDFQVLSTMKFGQFSLYSGKTFAATAYMKKNGVISFQLNYQISANSITTFYLCGIPQQIGGPVTFRLKNVDLRLGRCRVPVCQIGVVASTKTVEDARLVVGLSVNSPSGMFPGGYRELVRWIFVPSSGTSVCQNLTTQVVCIGTGNLGKLDLCQIGSSTPLASTFLDSSGYAVFNTSANPLVVQDEVIQVCVRGEAFGTITLSIDLLAVDAISASGAGITVQGLPVYGSVIQIV